MGFFTIKFASRCNHEKLHSFSLNLQCSSNSTRSHFPINLCLHVSVCCVFFLLLQFEGRQKEEEG